MSQPTGTTNDADARIVFPPAVPRGVPHTAPGLAALVPGPRRGVPSTFALAAGSGPRTGSLAATIHPCVLVAETWATSTAAPTSTETDAAPASPVSTASFPNPIFDAVPRKALRSEQELHVWRCRTPPGAFASTGSHQQIMTCIAASALACVGTPDAGDAVRAALRGDGEVLTPASARLLAAIQDLTTQVAAVPLDTSGRSRFGNRAYRVWQQYLHDHCVRLFAPVVAAITDADLAAAPLPPTPPCFAAATAAGALSAATLEAAFVGVATAAPPPEADAEPLEDAAARVQVARNAAAAFAALDARRQFVLCELLPYVLDAFGNATRIDYGTGHELHYLLALHVLSRAGVFGPAPAAADGVVAAAPAQSILPHFWVYLQLVVAIQRKFRLEPAGSHGVYGLDDYHHLPFVFGAAQLCPPGEWVPVRDIPHRASVSSAAVLGDAAGSQFPRPADIATPAVATQWGQDPLAVDASTGVGSNFFFLAMRRVFETKTGGTLAQHSPTLYSLTGLDSWPRVLTGLIKMYDGEVLAKFAIMQHLLFGRIIPAPSG